MARALLPFVVKFQYEGRLKVISIMVIDDSLLVVILLKFVHMCHLEVSS